ncbi:hypothetical protein BJV74DRAFT_987567 [Russula compacta]|nr:hypothetical protein BJV74DRAFT_987567 [Russula compacta]
MAHRYDLRPNAKRRRGRQSTDGQAEYTSSSSTNNGRISTGHDIIIDDNQEDKSVPVDSSAGPSHAPAAVDTTSPPLQDLGEQRLEDWRRHSVMSSKNLTTNMGSTTYRVERPPRVWDDVQASRRRMEAKRRAEAPRIAQEQVRLLYDATPQLLEKRIEALLQERDAEVERVRRKWERAWPRAIERGEIVMEEEEEVVAVERRVTMKNHCRVGSPGYAPTETSSMASDEEEEEDETEDKEVEEGDDDYMDEDEHNDEEWRSQSWSGSGIEYSMPLRRQPAQLMVLP